MWGDVGRCREMCGDVGRCVCHLVRLARLALAQPRLAHAPQARLGERADHLPLRAVADHGRRHRHGVLRARRVDEHLDAVTKPRPALRRELLARRVAGRAPARPVDAMEIVVQHLEPKVQRVRVVLDPAAQRRVGCVSHLGELRTPEVWAARAWCRLGRIRRREGKGLCKARLKRTNARLGSNLRMLA